MTALVLLVPLAVTSTNAMVKRLGGATWRRLHRLVYVIGILAALHFLWLAKVGRTDQYVYAAILTLLSGSRLRTLGVSPGVKASDRRLGGFPSRHSDPQCHGRKPVGIYWASGPSMPFGAS